MMSKQKWGGGRTLKSVVAIITMAAVLVLTLPVFKMDAGAARYAELPTFDYTALYEGGQFYLINRDSFENVFLNGAQLTGSPMDSTGTIPKGTVIMKVTGGAIITGVPNLNLSGLTENATLEGGQRTYQALGNTYPAYNFDYELYRFNSDVTYALSGTTFEFTPVVVAGEQSVPSSPGQQMNEANLSLLLAQIKAKLAEDQRIASERKYFFDLYQLQLKQAGIDNLWFMNVAEFNRNGIHIYVNPDHSVIPSTIPGLYWANNVPGFAGQAIDPTQAGNFLIETWNITPEKAPKSWATIMQVAEQNGFTVGGALQVNIGEKGPDNKPVFTSTNKAPVANIICGVPTAIQGEGAQYGAIVVIPGGSYHIYKDALFEDGHLTLPLCIGEHAVGVVRTN